MNVFIKLSLRWRVTLLTALVLVSCSIALTFFSIQSAQKTLMSAFSESIDIIIIENGVVLKQKDSIPTDNNEPPNEFESVKKAKQTFDVTNIAFCAMLSILGAGAVYFLSGKALKPVRNLSNRVAKINENNLSERLPESESKDEVGSLIKSFNHALDRLDEAFERQKRFSASAAHELKTPLATIKAGIQVLEINENSTLDEYKENAAITHASVDRLTQMVNDLLLLTSTEEDNSEIKEEIFLGEMMEAIFSELALIYENRNICYNIECDTKTLYGNTTLLYRAFYNAIDNAYKYNHENGYISVSAYSANDLVTITIEDNGCGIPAEHLTHLFEAFYRVDASRSRKIAGSGLGLSIVKAIVDRHKGTIHVASEVNKGTKFEIILPQ